MFTLKKSFEMAYKKLPYYHNDAWITNGCFAIKKNVVKDHFKHCLHVPGEQHPDISRVVVGCEDNSVVITKTDVLYDYKFCLARVFHDDEGNEYLVNEEYVKHFKITTLLAGDQYTPLCNEAKTFVVMPLRARDKVQKIA